MDLKEGIYVGSDRGIPFHSPRENPVPKSVTPDHADDRRVIDMVELIALPGEEALASRANWIEKRSAKDRLVGWWVLLREIERDRIEDVLATLKPWRKPDSEANFASVDKARLGR